LELGEKKKMDYPGKPGNDRRKMDPPVPPETGKPFRGGQALPRRASKPEDDRYLRIIIAKLAILFIWQTNLPESRATKNS